MVEQQMMDPMESKQDEPPPPPPGSGGRVALTTTGTGRLNYEFDITADVQLWPAGSTLGRRVIFVPLAGAEQFLAFGLYEPVNDPLYRYKTPFVAWGSVREHLGDFTSRMKREGAMVELYAEEPLQSLVAYVTGHFRGTTEQDMLVVPAWEQFDTAWSQLIVAGRPRAVPGRASVSEGVSAVVG